MSSEFGGHSEWHAHVRARVKLLDLALRHLLGRISVYVGMWSNSIDIFSLRHPHARVLGTSSTRRISRLNSLLRLNPNAGMPPLMLAAALLWLLAGCDRTPESLLYRPSEARMDHPPDEITDFKALFANNCSGCHGADGTRGPAPPIGNPLFAAMITDTELTEIIRHGRAGTLMPPFITTNGEGLTPTQISNVAQGIKEGKLGATSPHKLPNVVPPYHSARASIDWADIAAGSKLFAEYCARCHGDEGRGGSMAGALNEPAFLALMSDQAIRTVILTGRPDLKTKGKDAMPGYWELVEVTKENANSRWREIDQLVAYVSSWRKEGQQVSKGIKKTTEAER